MSNIKYINQIEKLYRARGNNITETDIEWVTELLEFIGEVETDESIIGALGMLYERILIIKGGSEWTGKGKTDFYYS
jgi:hypothetical protein|tara:strand:+ start:1262 stop:1492 length:231 start_codon:yes stop_codon:yes gene_type:complete